MLNEEIFIMEKINDFNEAKNLLEKYLDKKISINKLKKKYFIDDIKFIKEELEKAYLFKDKTKLDILFWLIFTFDLYSEEFINILCKKWHWRQEDGKALEIFNNNIIEYKIIRELKNDE